jgi:hypothetical protein
VGDARDRATDVVGVEDARLAVGGRRVPRVGVVDRFPGKKNAPLAGRACVVV